jgi:hypothetical protein
MGGCPNCGCEVVTHACTRELVETPTATPQTDLAALAKAWVEAARNAQRHFNLGGENDG